MKCPHCGNTTRLAPIRFGLPDFTEELARQLENEEVYLGGCLIMDGYPKFHCFACGENVGKRPVLRTRRGLEDYRLIVTGIHLVEEGSPQILMEKKDGQIRLEIRPASADPQSSYERLMTDEEWEQLLEVLYKQLYLHEWNRIFLTRRFPEGEKWELTIKLTEDREIPYKGFGAYPPYWEELKAVFRPFFQEAGIS